MANQCSHHQYFYNASAYGLSAEIQRPVQQSITAQASSNLSSSGGRGFQRVEKFCVPPFLCFDLAYTEVGGSFDECHNVHTTYAYSVVEKLNIGDMVTADKVVSRVATYSPTEGDDQGEHSFDITGSYFENLRIAGHKIDLKLSTHTIHKHNTYSKFRTGFHNGAAADLLPWGKQEKRRLNRLHELEDTYHALRGVGDRAKKWDPKKTKAGEGAYWCSAAGHLNLEEEIGDSELEGFGGIIVIPKFGVVRLAEMIIHQDYRRLTMIKVQMCSSSQGTTDGGHAGTGGGRPPAP
jgi:hypothetical protein